MTILISGAYGFVGSNLSRFLVERGHRCFALDLASGEPPQREGPRLSRPASGPYAALWTWDDLAQIPWNEIDAVVHLAGKAHDLKKVSDPESYFTVNVGLTEKLWAACAGKVGRFVYFSSIKAVDGDTPYARSKAAAEAFLESVAGGRTEIRVLRPCMIHGPGNKGNLNLLVQVVRKGIPWPLAAWENRRSFTSVANACAVVEALCGDAARSVIGPYQRGDDAARSVIGPYQQGNDAARSVIGPYQVFALCDDEAVSTNRLIALIAEAMGRKARLWRLPKGLMRFVARVGDVLHLPLNTERLGKLVEDNVVDNVPLLRALGWESMPVRAEDGLRSTLKSFFCEAGTIDDRRETSGT